MAVKIHIERGKENELLTYKEFAKVGLVVRVKPWELRNCTGVLNVTESTSREANVAFPFTSNVFMRVKEPVTCVSVRSQRIEKRKRMRSVR